MYSRCQTLLYLGRDKLVRFDVDASGRPRGFWVRARPIGAEIPTLVDAALRLGNRRPGKVWTLSEEFHTQKLTISTEVLIGLAAPEVARALAFEAESLSGQSAVDSDLASIPLTSSGGREDHWVVQIPLWIRTQTEEAVRAAGGRLAGMLHPGGLPLPLSESASSWRRLESWNGITMGVGKDATGEFRRVFTGADNRNSAAIQAIEQWSQAFDSSAVDEQLTEGRRTLPSGEQQRLFNLADEATIQLWLIAWAKVLGSLSRNVPCIVPPKQPLSAAHRLAIALMLGAVTAGFAFVDAAKTYTRLAELDKQQMVDKQRSDELAGLKKRLEALQKEKSEVTKQVRRLGTDVPLAEATVQAYRNRWTELLTTIATECPPNLVVQEIGGKTSDPSIRGVSLGMEPLNEFATDLAARLRPFGWRVSPTYKSLPGNGDQVLYEFTLYLVESAVVPQSKNSAGELVDSAMHPPNAVAGEALNHP